MQIWWFSAYEGIVRYLTGREQNLWHLILPSLVTLTLMKKDSGLTYSTHMSTPAFLSEDRHLVLNMLNP